MKKYTVGPGREILRDGKIVCYLGRLNPKEISPSELDEFTHWVADSLNKECDVHSIHCDCSLCGKKGT